MQKMADVYNSFTAEQLLGLLKQGDFAPVAFEELYDRYWIKLYATAYKRLHSREDAEEAVQSLFESLWRNRHKIKIKTSLENYLFSAIRYIVLRQLYKKITFSNGDSAENPEYCSPDYSTEETILVQDLSRQIDKVVRTLPLKCRNVFELSRYEMKTHKEIAAMMGVSEKTVENHITKALRLIRMNLNQFFIP